MEMDYSNGYTTLWKYLMPLDSTLKNGFKMVNLMLYVFCHNKKFFEKNKRHIA